jgi:hypothetical protein
VLKQGLGKIKSCLSCSVPRRPRPSASALVRRPRPHTTRAALLSYAVTRPAKFGVCIAPRVGPSSAPYWPDARRSAQRSVHNLPSLMRRTTAGAITPSSQPVGPHLFKAVRPSSSHPTPLPPLHRARHGRRLASHRLARPLGHRACEHLPKDP